MTFVISSPIRGDILYWGMKHIQFAVEFVSNYCTLRGRIKGAYSRYSKVQSSAWLYSTAVQVEITQAGSDTRLLERSASTVLAR